MKTVEMNLDMQRTEIIRQPFATDSPEVIKEVRCALSKAMEKPQKEMPQASRYQALKTLVLNAETKSFDVTS